jgi:cysteinyl-tRNA synthetase
LSRSRYVPKIIAFVQKIVDRGLAYRGASGSVYLDIEEFKKQGHHYRKLVRYFRRPPVRLPLRMFC